jgi:ribosomal protein S18 acetylase RimI-like enzyme
MKKVVNCRNSNLESQEDAEKFITLLNCYIRDPMGGGREWSMDEGFAMVSRLRKIPTMRVIFAERNGEVVGMALCFLGFSSFGGFPLLNIHDFIVREDCRGQGIGKVLMASLEEYARLRGCGRLTLEVREDNPAAMSLYRTSGFADCEPPMRFWRKNLKMLENCSTEE